MNILYDVITHFAFFKNIAVCNVGPRVGPNETSEQNRIELYFPNQRTTISTGRQYRCFMNIELELYNYITD